ncbi:MAG TPA: HAMP domain-containing sensor histidine kinase [Candidatus Dormibacteraeota bacterium]
MLVVAIPEPGLRESSWLDTAFLVIVATILGSASIQLKYGILNMSGAATSAAVALLSPLQAGLVGLAGQAQRAWSRRHYDRVPANAGSGLWGAAGASVRYACGTHGLPVQEAVALALFSGVVVNVIYTSVSLTFLTGMPALQMVRQILTPAVLGAYGYFLIAGALASTMLGHGLEGLWRASGLFVLAIAIGDSVGGRSIRAFLEGQLAATEPHVQYSRLAQGTFHDMRNHIAATKANLSEINARALDDEDASSLASAIASLDDALQLLVEAQDTGLPTSLTAFDRVDLAELCRQTVAIHRRASGRQHVALLSQTPDNEVPVFGNAVLLGEVITNLLINSIEASLPTGSVTVRCRSLAESAEVSVSDTGGGVPRDLIPRIFEPGFSTKAGSGRGLGLYTSLGIARQHHGDLRYVRDSAGSRFILTLPDYDRGKVVLSAIKGR